MIARNRRVLVLIGLATLLVMTAACAAPAPPAATTAPTTAPATAPTVAATSPTSSTLLKFTAPDCNYTDANKNPAEFKSIEATDANTVVFTLCHPDPDFLQKISFAAFGIEPKALLDKTNGDTTKVADKPIGTGPYTVKEWVRGDHITFQANPNYWGPAPSNKTVILKWSKEASQRLIEIQSGQADGMDNVATEDMTAVQNNPNLKLVPREPLTVVYLGMNNKFKPFDNELVRQAIAMAIDKARIVKNFYPTGSTVADQFLTSDIKPGYTDNFKATPYDVAAAKKMLADAGYPNGFDVQLSYRPVVRQYLPAPDKVAQDIQAQLKQIGVNVTLNSMESGAFLDQTESGNTPFFLLGWIDDYPGATDIIDPNLGPAVKQFGNPYPDLNQEITAAASTADDGQRQQHYDKVNQLLQQHVPEVPLVHGTSACAYTSKVRGAQCSPLSDEYFQYLNNGTDQVVWVQNAEPLSLWCADEEDGETFRPCIQIYDALYNYEQNGTKPVPGLATSFQVSPDASTWTFKLRQGVKFSDSSAFSANDVVASFDAWWDAKSPNHKGRTGNWTYFGSFFGAQLNAK